MPVVDLMLWQDFCEFCDERGYDLANAVAESLGDQFDYEEQDGDALKRKTNFGVYLQEAFWSYLDYLI